MQTAQHMRLGGRTELAPRPNGLVMRQRPVIAPRLAAKPVLASSKRAEETGMHVLMPGEARTIDSAAAACAATIAASA